MALTITTEAGPTTGTRSRALPFTFFTGAAMQLIDAKAVGDMLGVSWRTVLRLADARKDNFPWGLKVGALRRGRLDDVTKWIDSQARRAG